MTTIKLELGEWIYNAGIVGLCNILEHSHDEIIIENDYVEFDDSILENFENKYFKYLIDTYEPVLSYSKILNIEDFIIKHKNEDFENFSNENLEYLNKYIADVLKYYLKSNSYKAAYPLIDSNVDILALEKSISKVSKKKTENIEDIKENLVDVFNKIEEVLNFIKLEDSKKYLAGKNIVYNIIRNGWDGVSFLNRATKEKDFYIDYGNYFVEPVVDYLEADKSKYKYTCFTCNREMKNFNNDISFVNNLGFDVARKSAHVWNFDNDIAVCPVCKLVLSCIPAGFTYIFDKGIFINDNINIESLIRTNNKLMTMLDYEVDNKSYGTNKALVKALFNANVRAVRNELQDIQVIRLIDGDYKFNILTKSVLNIINDSKEDLEKIESTGYKEINSYFYIYNIVLDNILNNRNMYLLIEKLLHYKISKNSNLFYNTSHIIRVLKINNRYLREVEVLSKEQEGLIQEANKQGYFLRQAYKEKGSVDKLNGIAYRLLNALKISNISMFMDTILNSYLYTKKQVPKIIVESQKDIDIFKTMGYSFIAGLIEGVEYNTEGNYDK
ncbi:type I-B CRISPR-associated protein Cas8b1/Cst1 [Miniphocaeibacter halophilus]|uniref:Type I-B CRISPR-associated protein Cas8b1/Cst1 n=1 Tax=Miniphocaeibacter halophilus TaxID=2931922 RepID=A0AC61MT24_9FIRM|nr:type I-B CRISPR-associated protein Cas8b1/Cst1 [Miniphocaeibacter halophilus]QQK08752.1 type I-B CRISPR-associated protein Cas8b1/Cst1 [Miniphocaeibacter halophilus]